MQIAANNECSKNYFRGTLLAILTTSFWFFVARMVPNIYNNKNWIDFIYILFGCSREQLVSTWNEIESTF